jgi:Zn-finger nucleic acid-binding protein
MMVRSGVEIDYCPQCRGVWLDRGELDKLMERESSSVEATPRPSQPYTGNDYRPQGEYRSQGEYRPDYDDDDYRKKKKKKGFLSDIFDFD